MSALPPFLKMQVISPALAVCVSAVKKSCTIPPFLWYKEGMKAWMMTLVAAAVCCWGAAGQTPRSADELLQHMRESMVVGQSDKDVLGSIRKGSQKIPFSLSPRGETIVFQYKQADAWQRFDVHIGDKKVDLLQVNNGKAVVMAPANYAKSIAGTDVTYEDLSLRFLYWKGGTILPDSADSRIKGRDCYIVQVPNPTPGVGQFATVRMWIDKENGTVWQVDGYGTDGKLRKRFTITSVKRLSDGSWFFKQMKMEVRDPQSGRTTALDYLEMDDIPDKKK